MEARRVLDRTLILVGMKRDPKSPPVRWYWTLFALACVALAYVLWFKIVA